MHKSLVGYMRGGANAGRSKTSRNGVLEWPDALHLQLGVLLASHVYQCVLMYQNGVIICICICIHVHAFMCHCMSPKDVCTDKVTSFVLFMGPSFSQSSGT